MAPAEAGGFNFDLCKRNDVLRQKGVQGPGFTKTGTTIAGVIFKVRPPQIVPRPRHHRSARRALPRRRPAPPPRHSPPAASLPAPQDGVVLGADTRSTAGTTVADKNCEKIHFIAPNIYCCGAGTAADTENVTGMVASQLELHRYGTGRASRVVTAMSLLKAHLFRYQGHVSAALVLGGVDLHGPHLFTVYPHGSTDALPYCTMGSGSLNAMAVFEAGYKDDMTREEAVALVAAAIRSGVYNDLGSGSNIDVCVITKEGVDYQRNLEFLQDKTYARQHPQTFAPGTTRESRGHGWGCRRKGGMSRLGKRLGAGRPAHRAGGHGARSALAAPARARRILTPRRPALRVAWRSGGSDAHVRRPQAGDRAGWGGGRGDGGLRRRERRRRGPAPLLNAPPRPETRGAGQLRRRTLS
jgi:20S proteasome subunit beta 2